MPPLLITRFAPSPTGHLHLGHAYSAILAHETARVAGGRFILRLEDIDQSRCLAPYSDAIIDDLRWLGLEWDGPVRRQSQHFGDYQSALDQLAEKGLLYPCFCTRKDIAAEIARAPTAPHGPEGALYPGLCKALSHAEAESRIASGEAYALRLDSEAAIRASGGPGALAFHDEEGCRHIAHPEELGDVVLARKDVPTSYHLAVTVDDAIQNISHVIRGEDLRHATHIHRLLQALLDLPTPIYQTHALLTDERGRRLAKRDKAQTLQSLRQEGWTPDDVRAAIKRLSGGFARG
ncbi:tRNA glutamyl-Q(34) synthetase GluQRS [Iodidimonas nitroreducens]|uniref:tRNA glutamyl-Q(34) synthetase GluQRS n=1 Tax=Iodidimonas nitroreducens TaxID=1236968 RepID=A0A5A7NCY0_9PROT|nr:tRNA glutamyl-Q(34) synthetase GluQRS [Iodidimonas nitroreducens]GAK34017.1 glutamyl-Q tRNA(Asp) synthetase [alpha proteobacterium Q-1]GER05485.1 tRNA glutamyl-Q(34) synthetase GluQRS [Iodidimonas nitroreducens]